jgi:hypothetical protein
LYTSLLFEGVQRGGEGVFGFLPAPGIGQQAPQFLVPDGLAEGVAKLLAQRDAAAQIGLGGAELAYVDLCHMRQVAQANRQVQLVVAPLTQHIMLLKQRYSAARLSARGVAVRQRVQRPRLGIFAAQARRVVFAVGEQPAQQVDLSFICAELEVKRIGKAIAIDRTRRVVAPGVQQVVV